MASAVVRLSVRAAGSSQGFWVLMTCFLSGPLRLSVIMSLKISLKELESHCSVPREQRRNIVSRSRLRVLWLSQKWWHIGNERRNPGTCNLKDSMTAMWILSLKLVSL